MSTPNDNPVSEKLFTRLTSIASDSPSAEAFAQSALSVLAETDLFAHAWIGLGGTEEGLQAILTEGWPESDKSIPEIFKNTPPPCWQDAIETPEPNIISSPRAICGECPRASAYDALSAMAVRLTHRNVVLGVLCVGLRPDLAVADETHDQMQRIVSILSLTLYGFRMEQRQRTLASKYDFLLHHTNDAIFIHGMNSDEEPTRFTEVNRVACQRLGYTREELLSKTPLDIDAPETHADTRQRSQDAVRRGDILFEQVHMAKDGRRIPVEVNSRCYTLDGESVCISIARDITERQQARNAADKEAYLRASLLEAVPSPIFYKDIDGRYLGCNSAFARLFDMAPDDIVGKTAFDLVPEISARTFRAQDEALFNDPAGIQRYEETVLDVKAGAREVIFNKATFVGPDGKVAGLVGVITDISDQKRIERELEESRTFLTSVLDGLPSNIAILDSDGTIIAVNKQWKIFGEDNDLSWGDNGVGQNYLAICDSASGDWAEGARQAADGIRAVIAGERPDFSMEYPCHSPDMKRWFLLRACRLDTEDKTHVVVTHLDITTRRVAEDEVRESKEKLELLLNVMPSAVFTVDRNQIVTSWNRHATEITGISAHEIIGKTCRVFADQPCTTVCGLFDGELDGPIIGRECTIRKVDGTERVIRKNASLLYDANGGVTGGVECFLDITDQKELEERLRQGEKMEAIGQLAGGIAHDFNNQLAGIIGYADLLTSSLKDQPNLHRYAEMVLRGAHRSADLNRQLLAFARKGKYQHQTVNLHDVIEEVIGLLEHTLDKRIDIQREFRAPESSVEGDPSQLQNALLNIAINGRDAMANGGNLTFMTDVVQLEDIYCSRQPESVSPGMYLRVAVSDTGHGMDATTQKRIFEPFFTTKQDSGGTGMGLAAVYGAVHNHNGTIDVYSEPERGTTFNIYLPLAKSVQKRIQPTTQPKSGTGHILLVDDEELVRELGRDLLNKLGYDVTTCNDGMEAIDVYRDHGTEIDLVMLDMIMPKITGSETFYELRKINPDVRVLFASGYGLEDELDMLTRNGARGFIQKPFQLTTLSSAVANALDDACPAPSA